MLAKWKNANNEIPPLGESVDVFGNFEIDGCKVDVTGDFEAAVFNDNCYPPVWFYDVVDQEGNIYFVEGVVTHWKEKNELK